MTIFTMLGVGHSESMMHWNNNAALIAQEGLILIDAGYTIKFALANAGYGFQDIHSIFITHVHADHCFGLERIGYECRFKYGLKPKLYVSQGVYGELWHNCLKGPMGHVGEGPATLEDFFDVKIIKNDKFSSSGIEIEVFENIHTPNMESYGFMIEDQLIYTGDTKVIPEVIGKRNFSNIFHDCMFADWNPVHATFSEIQAAYTKSQKAKMFLMSYNDEYVEYVDQVNSEFAGLAEETKRIEI